MKKSKKVYVLSVVVQRIEQDHKGKYFMTLGDLLASNTEEVGEQPIGVFTKLSDAKLAAQATVIVRHDIPKRVAKMVWQRLAHETRPDGRRYEVARGISRFEGHKFAITKLPLDELDPLGVL